MGSTDRLWNLRRASREGNLGRAAVYDVFDSWLSDLGEGDRSGARECGAWSWSPQGLDSKA